MNDRTTDALIDALAQDVRPVRRSAVPARLALALGAGGVLALAGVLFGLGARGDLMPAMHGAAFWMKAGYTAALAALAVPLTARLARPERRGLATLWLTAVPVVLIAVLAVRELAMTPPGRWAAMWLGHSWRFCPVVVFVLALPILAAFLWAFRGCAPTRLRASGAVAGLAAGASAATLYGLACDETSALFLVTWYSLGIVGATALGALLGPRVLRW